MTPQSLPGESEEAGGFPVLMKHCREVGVRGQVELRVYDGRVHKDVLGIARKTPIPEDQAARLVDALQAALDAIAAHQGLPIRSLETTIMTRSLKADHSARRISLPALPQLVRAIVIGRFPESLEGGGIMRLNPHRQSPVMVSRPHLPETRVFEVADLAAAAGLDGGRLADIYQDWRDRILELLLQPCYIELAERVDVVSGHDMLIATSEIDRLAGDLGVA